MGIRVPPPPPRNEAEMLEQIRMLERDLFITRTMHLIVMIVAILGVLVIAILRVLAW